MLVKEYTGFIFARGGSKGVKRKNIRPINGTPLIGIAIENALKSKYIKDIIVSTDDNEIAETALQYGAADIIKRPDSLSSDKAPEIEAWRHAINLMEDIMVKNDDIFISLPTTSPLRHASDIDQAIKAYVEKKPDILFAICESRRNPYLNMVTVNGEGNLSIVNKIDNAYQRQSVPKTYDVCTYIYVSNKDYILNCKTLMEGNVGHIEIPPERSIDIDDEYDLYLAELLTKYPYVKGVQNG